MSSMTTLVPEEEWQQHLESYWQGVLSSWAREKGYDGEPAYEHFFKTGNVEEYIRLAVANKEVTSWSRVLQCNPFRDLEQLKKNIQGYWTWLLEKPEEYLPNTGHGGKVDLMEYFLGPVRRLGSVNSPVMDPESSARLFSWIYGQSFEAKRVFPMALGKDKWQPEIEVDADEQFFYLTGLIINYLYGDKDSLISRQALVLIDYWFSLFSHASLIQDKRLFALTVDEDDELSGGIAVGDCQRNYRTFLALLNGYNVLYEEDPSEAIEHHDPTFEGVVKQRFSALDLPEEQGRLLALIHEQKEDCVWGLEE